MSCLRQEGLQLDSAGLSRLTSEMEGEVGRQMVVVVVGRGGREDAKWKK